MLLACSQFSFHPPWLLLFCLSSFLLPWRVDILTGLAFTPMRIVARFGETAQYRPNRGKKGDNMQWRDIFTTLKYVARFLETEANRR